MGLKEARENKGLTQNELAIMLNVNRTTITKWETLGTMPRPKLLGKICSILGITIEEVYKTKETS